jgi:hypothetical protein
MFSHFYEGELLEEESWEEVPDAVLPESDTTPDSLQP